jgi:surfeit locus 1 family protein
MNKWPAFGLSSATKPSRERLTAYPMLTLFSRRWILTTLLAIVAVGVLIRLGIWQLDRLAQRRAFNARVIAQQKAKPLTLDSTTLDADLLNMEYRAVIVMGTYDHAQQVVLRNQVWGNQPGVHLLTPLIISGTNKAVLVDRGWVPQEDVAPDKRGKYDQPGPVTVRGVIRHPQAKPDFGGVPDPPLAPGQTRLDAWNIVNLERISQQVSVPLSSAYIQQSPEANPAHPPYRSEPQLDLTEGPHFGYALQWFTFAAILAIGYPAYVHRQTSRES